MMAADTDMSLDNNQNDTYLKSLCGSSKQEVRQNEIQFFYPKGNRVSLIEQNSNINNFVENDDLYHETVQNTVRNDNITTNNNFSTDLINDDTRYHGGNKNNNNFNYFIEDKLFDDSNTFNSNNLNNNFDCLSGDSPLRFVTDESG